MQWLMPSLAAQGILLAVILLVLPAGQRLANRLLAILVLTFSARLLATESAAAMPGLLLLHNVAFLLGPLLWLYARALTDPVFRLRAVHAWHAVPAGLVTLANMVVLTDYEWGLEDPALIRTTAWHGMAASTSVIVYCVLILRELGVYRQALLQQLEGPGLQWLQVLTGLLLLSASGGLLVNLLRLIGSWPLNPVSLIVLPASILLFYTVAIFGFRQSRLLFSMEVLPPAHSGPDDRSPAGIAQQGEEESEHSEAAARYQRSGLDPARLQKLWQQLERLVADERLWQDSQLDLRALAVRLDVAPQVLSQVFNAHAGIRFYDYINQLRVAEAQRLLHDPARQDDTILEIAMAAGFSSKSTFNKYFRQHTGLTPTVWRNQ